MTQLNNLFPQLAGTTFAICYCHRQAMLGRSIQAQRWVCTVLYHTFFVLYIFVRLCLFFFSYLFVQKFSTIRLFIWCRTACGLVLFAH